MHSATYSCSCCWCPLRQQYLTADGVRSAISTLRCWCHVAVVALLTAHAHHAIVAAAVSLLTTSTHPLTAVLFPRVHRIYLDMHTRTVHTARATLLLCRLRYSCDASTYHHEYTSTVSRPVELRVMLPFLLVRVLVLLRWLRHPQGCHNSCVHWYTAPS